MEETLLGLVKQTPALLVLAFIVQKFLSAMRDWHARQIAYEQARESSAGDRLGTLAEACHTVQRDAIEVMAEARQELGASRATSVELLAYLRSVKE